MWNVPANAASGATAESRSRGRRVSSRLTLTWAPSGSARRRRRSRTTGGTASGSFGRNGGWSRGATAAASAAASAAVASAARPAAPRHPSPRREQPIEHDGGDVREHACSAVDDVLGAVVRVAHPPVGLDREHLGAGDELGARLARGAGELAA